MTDMRVTFLDPDQRLLYADALPDGGYGVFAQKDKNAPRLLTGGGIDRAGYATLEAAQAALGIYVSQKRDGSAYYKWTVIVNGYKTTFDDYYAMRSGTLAVPTDLAPAERVTLANIEYRIAAHMQGTYREFLEVGRCLNDAKDAGLIRHGEWEAWVKRNTGLSERQAQKLMQAARSVPAGSAMERLPISKIQALLALPENEREEMAQKAVEEDMSLRDMQKQIDFFKKRAEKSESGEAAAKSEAKRVSRSLNEAYEEMRKKDEEIRRLEDSARDEIERIKADITASYTGEGVSAEARAEIDRLKAALADAEAFAEAQAEQRQQAQRALLMAQSDAARGDAPVQEGFSVIDLAAAVRAFIGAAGVLPHMGAVLAAMGQGERREITQYVDMVAAWAEGARRALDTLSAGE